MTKKLYIRNLPYSTTDESLKQFFSQAGTVISANVIMDKFSGRSRGFGFVEMSGEEETQKAIKELNGKDFDGRELLVNEARPMKERDHS